MSQHNKLISSICPKNHDPNYPTLTALNPAGSWPDIIHAAA